MTTSNDWEKEFDEKFIGLISYTPIVHGETYENSDWAHDKGNTVFIKDSKSVKGSLRNELKSYISSLIEQTRKEERQKIYTEIEKIAEEFPYIVPRALLVNLISHIEK